MQTGEIDGQVVLLSSLRATQRAAWEAGVQKLLADPKYKAAYTHNNLQPGFMAQKDYARFIADFGDETQKFLRDTGVIK